MILRFTRQNISQPKKGIFLFLERRFIQRIKNIEKLLIEGGESNVLEACGSLRIFLLDDFLDQVNKFYKEEIVFQIPADGIPPTIEGEVYSIARIYSVPRDFEHILLNKRDFLKHSLVYVKGERVTIKQMVRLAANYLGVHHFGDSKSACKGEKTAYGEYDIFKTNAIPALLMPMEDISYSFLDAIEPLVRSIVEKYYCEG